MDKQLPESGVNIINIVHLNTFDKYGYLAFIFSHYEIYHQERARGNLTIDD
jgi:hypothetical protein